MIDSVRLLEPTLQINEVQPTVTQQRGDDTPLVAETPTAVK